MWIGSDVSLTVCKHEGYMQMKYGVRKLYPKKVIQPDVPVTLYATWPAYCLREKGYTVPYDSPRCYRPREGGRGAVESIAWPTRFEEEYTVDELMEMYRECKEEINSVMGYEEDLQYPSTPHDILEIAVALTSVNSAFITCVHHL